MGNFMTKKIVQGVFVLCAPILISELVILWLLKIGVISVTVAFIVTLIVMLVIIIGGVRVGSAIFMPIRAAMTGESIENRDDKYVKKAQEIAQRNDELGEAFRNIQNTFTGLSTTIGAIREACGELGDVSTQLSDMFNSMEDVMGNTSLAVDTITGNTMEQASRIKDIKDKTDAISQAIDLITKNTDALSDSMHSVNDCSQSVEQILSELISISEKNGIAIREVRKQTQMTNDSVQEIQSVTEIIASISNQTNLLALNASIEAARAGENGKGFAVVAEEIRTLADQSKQSTEHIYNIVNTLKNNSNASVEITGHVAEAFEQQEQKMHDTEEIFTTLNAEFAKVGSAIMDIDKEIDDLEVHKNVIASSVDNLNQFSDENVESSQTAKNSMDDLGNVMDSCKGITDKVTGVSKNLVDNIKDMASMRKLDMDKIR